MNNPNGTPEIKITMSPSDADAIAAQLNKTNLGLMVDTVSMSLTVHMESGFIRVLVTVQ